MTPHPHITSDTGIKTSQRVSRSCIECGRRKIRCDKKSPCQPCIWRNAAHECRRPIARVRGQLTVYTDADADTTAEFRVEELLRERDALQAQITELETALALSKPFTYSRPGATTDPSPPTTLFEELVTAFEQFDLGIRTDTLALSVTEKDIAHRLYEPATDPIFLLLPTREASYQIVTFSLRTLGWLHCAVDADEFLAEHEVCWESIQVGAGLKREQRPWLILYLVVLAVGVLYIEPADIPPSEQLPQLTLLPKSPVDIAVHICRIWYEAALKEIERFAFAGTLSIPIVQALSVLTLCHSNFGEHQREWLFTGFATNMSRCLDMDKLGRESSFSSDLTQRPEWNTPLSRELGRRLWWGCVIRDWLSSWGKPVLISPASFCCQFSTKFGLDSSIPSNPRLPRHPGMLTSVNLGTPSPAHYHSIMSRLSYIFYIYVKANSRLTPAKLAKAVEEIQKVHSNLPLHLSAKFPETDDDMLWETEHPWVSFQRYLISFVLDFMQLSIARLLVPKNPEEDSRGFRQVSIQCALRLLNRYATPAPRFYRLVWVVSAATAAAALYASLDMLVHVQDYSGEGRIRMIELLNHVAVELSQHTAVAVHAAKGFSVIESLLPLIAQASSSNTGSPYTLHELLQQLSNLNRSVYPVPDPPLADASGANPGGVHEDFGMFVGLTDTTDTVFDINDWDNIMLQFKG